MRSGTHSYKLPNLKHVARKRGPSWADQSRLIFLVLRPPARLGRSLTHLPSPSPLRLAHMMPLLPSLSSRVMSPQSPETTFCHPTPPLMGGALRVFFCPLCFAVDSELHGSELDFLFPGSLCRSPLGVGGEGVKLGRDTCGGHRWTSHSEAPSCVILSDKYHIRAFAGSGCTPWSGSSRDCTPSERACRGHRTRPDG